MHVLAPKFYVVAPLPYIGAMQAPFSGSTKILKVGMRFSGSKRIYTHICNSIATMVFHQLLNNRNMQFALKIIFDSVYNAESISDIFKILKNHIFVNQKFQNQEF